MVDLARTSARYTIAANGASPVEYLPSTGASVAVSPDATATMRVYRSISRPTDIEADLADGSLSYANLIAGTQPTTSRWMLWASGAVTVDTWQGPEQGRGDTAVIATATTAGGVLEVSS